MSDFVTLVAYFWVFFKGYVIVTFILSKVLTALYLKFTGYQQWYLGLVPFGHVYFKHDLAGINYIVLIIQIIAEIIFITSYQLIPFVIAFILSVYTNYCFARIYADQYNDVVYAVVPFGKYYIMVNEVIKNARDESR